MKKAPTTQYGEMHEKQLARRKSRREKKGVEKPSNNLQMLKPEDFPGYDELQREENRRRAKNRFNVVLGFMRTAIKERNTNEMLRISPSLVSASIAARVQIPREVQVYVHVPKKQK